MTGRTGSATLANMKVALTLVCAVLVVIPGIAFAGGSPAQDISIDSWIYDAVFALSSRGHFPELLLHTRPYTRGAVASYLEQIAVADRAYPLGDRILIDRLRDEFREELRTERNDDGDEFVRLGIGPTAHIDQIRHGAARNRAGFDAVGSFGVGRSFATRARLRVDTDGRHDSQFHGEYWKEHFTAWLEQAVLTGHVGRFTGAFGREYWRWGRSPIDAMLMSNHSPPFNGLRLLYRSTTWSFQLVATMLDSMLVPEVGKANRYLIGHRFNWRPRHNLELAVSEVIVFGGVDRPWALNYLNPIVPYYWEQLNNDTNDNPLWNFELSWRPLNRLEVYGEWMIDDFQIDFHSEPQQIGVLIGTAWTPDPQHRLLITAEYQRINTFVYGQSRPWNRYYHHRSLDGHVIGIGATLGTDADRMTLRPTWHHSKWFDVRGLFEYVRHGENRIDSEQAGTVPKNVPFPSGIVERRATVALGPHIQLGGTLILDMLAGYQRTTNVGNVDGHDQEGALFRLRLSSLVWKTFGV
ncbi:MAG: hypothetical protein GF341_01020 [candidate division Zixibacteria bacterium]|nr:hypothetical protein [candidate division Zixibacteria bacterium]